MLRKLKSLGLSRDDCVGFGTDGCSVMISEKGAVKEIQKEASNAVMTHCYSHKLNNVISQSSKDKIIENTVDVMKEICNTRWVEQHDGVLQFTTDMPEIVEAL
ncbi:hypothetical protein PR048_019627 [Dryococelus australis]|uniref:Uncharacterized protein n=1 Tax=Dryococelus australis TaxID=614101 RepID=A0ABQ9H4A4_9NEOP|nr:hypothetical protein PR048_019627 [Dryococelus australis]